MYGRRISANSGDGTATDTQRQSWVVEEGSRKSYGRGSMGNEDDLLVLCGALECSYECLKKVGTTLVYLCNALAGARWDPERGPGWIDSRDMRLEATSRPGPGMESSIGSHW
jgi:hypothetical protein